jgi:hypothetical protein
MKTGLLFALPLLAVIGCASAGNDASASSAAAASGPAPGQTIAATTSALYAQLDSVLDVRAVEMKSTLDVHVLRVKTKYSQGGEIFLAATHTREGGIFDLGYDVTEIASVTTTGEDDVVIAGKASTDQGPIEALNASVSVVTADDGVIQKFALVTTFDAANQDHTESMPMATDAAIDELSVLDSMQTKATPNGTSVRLFDLEGESFGESHHLLFHLASGAKSKTYDLGVRVDTLDDMTVLDNGTARIVGSTFDDAGKPVGFVYTIAFQLAADGSAPPAIALTRLQ